MTGPQGRRRGSQVEKEIVCRWIVDAFAKCRVATVHLLECMYSTGSGFACKVGMYASYEMLAATGLKVRVLVVH